jgi:formylglycine-generating enzyme required for sulfatase activity
MGGVSEMRIQNHKQTFLHKAVFATLLLGMATVYSVQASVQVQAQVDSELTWQEAMFKVRAELPEPSGPRLPDTEVVCGPWYTTGPIAAETFDQELWPETEPLDFGCTVDPESMDVTPECGWTPIPSLADGRVHSLPTNEMDVSATYLVRTINANRPTQFEVGLGSADGLTVWLNDERLHDRDVQRAATSNSDLLALPLVKGENTLLLKIFSLRGAHAFYFGSAQDEVPEAAIRNAWDRMAVDYPIQTAAFQRVAPDRYLAWFRQTANASMEPESIKRLLDTLGPIGVELLTELDTLWAEKADTNDPRYLELFDRASHLADSVELNDAIDMAALRLAVEDLTATYPEQYDAAYLEKLTSLESRLLGHQLVVEEFAPFGSDHEGFQNATNQLNLLQVEIASFQREALLANPLFDFDRLLVLRRDFGFKAESVMSAQLGMPSLNSRTHDTLPHYGWENEVAVISDLRGDAEIETLYKTPNGEILCETDLHFDGDRIMFSSIGTNDRWHLFEMGADGSDVRQLTPIDLSDVDFFDSCYMGNGKIAVTSTAAYQGLPCEGGKRPMAVLYSFDPATQNIRQLTFEQDSDWCPSMLENGRVMYTRWEYSDLPHYFSRILFHCNPDGTNQSELYGSGSYWPNGIFYARQVPAHPNLIVGIVSGHHGLSRSGQMVLFDTSKGRKEAGGVVQTFLKSDEPTDPIIVDRLYNASWPHFLQPYPLNEKYYLVSAKLTPDSLWGVYLIDIYDNMTLIKELPGAALLEPIPLQPTTQPAPVYDRVDMTQDEGTVFIADIYSGPGLAGVPRGTVKKLRLFSYHFNYLNTGGHNSVGIESSWDVKRILGTVTVEEDGSASFRVPANTPISMQPLDEEGRALQLMRSWFVAMPGELVSCVGCHESQNDVVPARPTTASYRPPEGIEPWYGPARPFGFRHEVQPVLDEYCVGCHNGETLTAATGDQLELLDYSRSDGSLFSRDKAYLNLHPYVRRPGPESDIAMLRPMEYHADTSELVQILKAGHYNVQLDREAWERLYAWIDLNVPHRGAWSPEDWRENDQIERRRELSLLYAGLQVNPEEEYALTSAAFEATPVPAPIVPDWTPTPAVELPSVANWPFDATTATALQETTASHLGFDAATRSIDLGDGQAIQLNLIPAGTYVMGSASGSPHEHPPTLSTIERPFWMSVTEITNAQYAKFDPSHDSRYIDQRWKDHIIAGYPANLPEQPVIRISQEEASTYCQWLSELTDSGDVRLPTETEWEWSCRTGSAMPFWYGDAETDFGRFANFADLSSRDLAVKGCSPKIIPNPSPIEAFLPKVESVDDGAKIVREVGAATPNPWGLYDMHGNVCEWTSSPYGGEGESVDMIAVRGGSWRDRPYRGTATFRLPYQSYQKVFNVGFRVVIPIE